MYFNYDLFTALCREKGQSPYEVVENLGMGKSSISKWKSRSEPCLDSLYKLANYLDVPVSYLLNETGNGPKSEVKYSKDADIRRIELAKEQMSKEEWEHQLKIITASFGDYFSDGCIDDDLEE